MDAPRLWVARPRSRMAVTPNECWFSGQPPSPHPWIHGYVPLRFYTPIYVPLNRPAGTTNRQPPPTANRQPPPTASLTQNVVVICCVDTGAKNSLCP